MSEIFDGRFEETENQELTYIVIGGYDTIWRDVETKYGCKHDIYETIFQIPLGVFTNMNEAYGKGFLYLSGMINGEDNKEGLTITSPVRMGDDQGMIFGIKGESNDIYTWVQILWRYEERSLVNE